MEKSGKKNNPIICVIAAVDQNGVYAEGNSMPWHIPEDFKHFKRLTVEHTVVMGRRTWESLPEKNRPLPDRHNMVITRAPGYVAEGAQVFGSLTDAIDAVVTEKAFCIGGFRIWHEAMGLASDAWGSVLERSYPRGRSTQTAAELLRPFETWPEFHLHDNPVIMSGNLEKMPNFQIRHWKAKR